MQIEIEHKIAAITMDDATMQEEMNKLTAEGWVMIPEIKPVAIYHLVRAKPGQAASVGLGAKLEIDDSKVGILRNGKVYWPDGTVTDEGVPR